MRKIATALLLVMAFGVGQVTAGSYETAVTPGLEACAVLREAAARGISVAKLPEARRACMKVTKGGSGSGVTYAIPKEPIKLVP
jgi:hypothetical protein